MSTFDAEWEQMKREASGETGMSLASADNKPNWGQGGSGNLKSSKNAWTTAAGGVGKLRGDIKTALTKLEEEQTGLGAGSKSGGGIESAAAQRELYSSWKRYLNGVSGRCGAIQDRLERAGDHHYKNDEAIKGAFDGLDGLYKDTKPVGGESRGR
ncbi:hypothetical protein HUF15_43125 [Streptomyces samsunensis]|uniref:Uncharacterized protein n=1 Tax=Streptomyces autolyticus TaxID=75293 RepID=A0ABM6HJQ7_9ACTN|nr:MULTISPECIES: hypothetical protein [Streptomyces]AQA14359.1 hypothetical protein BV401_32065 [Streptomyces autolyticus]MCQ6252325.1 hypothetical protein [Streptomyces malaysiensis]NUH43411.1 hypothetical protein [Streptomyces samsunensis]WHX18240.1 hypothetical protein QFW82_14865 [Streptomyces sp. NA07423]